MQRPTIAVTPLFALVSAIVLVAACGGGSQSGSASKGEIRIASDLPTSGADASDGLPEQNGAAFAISQAASIKGYTLKLVPFDDTVNGVHDPQKGAQNVSQMIADSKVLAMIGPNNSNVAQAEIPIANRDNLLMVSPSTTSQCLTLPDPTCNPPASALRPVQPNNFFRVAPINNFQATAMASYFLNNLKASKVAVFSDNESFGKGIADLFNSEFTRMGGTVVARQDFDWKSTNDFRPFLQQAKAKGAQAIYGGATPGTKECIVLNQLGSVFNPQIPFGGPGINNDQCIKDAGSSFQNVYSTYPGGNALQNPAAQDTVAAFKKAYPNAQDLGAYTFATYDSMSIAILAIGYAIDAAGGKMPTRLQVVQAMQKVSNYKGLTGTYSFTTAGDPVAPTIGFYKATAGAWVFDSQTAVQSPQ